MTKITHRGFVQRCDQCGVDFQHRTLPGSRRQRAGRQDIDHGIAGQIVHGCSTDVVDERFVDRVWLLPLARIALRRLDGGKVTSVQIAENKAFTAAAHRRKTHTFTNTYPGEEAWGIFTQHYGRFTVFVGGFPIEVDGEVVGGIGASGGNGEQDIASCEAGIAAFQAYLEKGGG